MKKKWLKKTDNYLDKHRLAFSLQDDFKIREGQLKSMFKDSVKDIIPSEVYQTKKRGFEMPFAEWMNGVLNDKFKNVIKNPKSEVLFEKSFLKALKKRIYTQTLKKTDWMVLVFLSWVEKFEVEF